MYPKISKTQKLGLTLFLSMLCLFSNASQAMDIVSDLFQSKTLEFENVLQYKLDLNPATKIPERISGLCGASACCVQEITTKTNQSALIVLVKIKLCKDKQTGNFSFPINMGNDIKELKFGLKEYSLWKRQ